MNSIEYFKVFHKFWFKPETNLKMYLKELWSHSKIHKRIENNNIVLKKFNFHQKNAIVITCYLFFPFYTISFAVCIDQIILFVAFIIQYMCSYDLYWYHFSKIQVDNQYCTSLSIVLFYSSTSIAVIKLSNLI